MVLHDKESDSTTKASRALERLFLYPQSSLFTHLIIALTETLSSKYALAVAAVLLLFHPFCCCHECISNEVAKITRASTEITACNKV